MSALKSFVERHGIAATLLFVVGSAASAAIIRPHVPDGGLLRELHNAAEKAISQGLALIHSEDGPKFDVDHAQFVHQTKQEMEAHRAALLAATDALNRMVAASDMNSDRYPSGPDGLADRERDLNIAGGDYAAAMAKLDAEGEAEAIALSDAGPGDGWKTDEFAFFNHALNAVGLDVEGVLGDVASRP